MEIGDLLKGYGVDITGEVMRDYLQEVECSYEFIHHREEVAICVALLKKWDEKGGSVVFIPPPKEEGYPQEIIVGLLASDWPGMSDSCVAAVHKRNWNIRFMKGFIVEHKAQKLAVIILALELGTPQAVRDFWLERASFIRSLERASLGSQAKRYLLSKEARKLEIYGEVAEIVGELCRSREKKGLLEEGGEAVKFFASRSEAYITERKIEDLARQIITNFRFVRRVRRPGGRAQVWVKNLETAGGTLTGITIVGLDRDFSLNDCLEAIARSVPGFKNKYNKEFITEDGIIVYRLEITNGEDKALSRRKQETIRKSILKMASTRKMERMKWMESLGGVEHYLRAIIPFLLQEYRSTGKIQVYISVSRSTEELIEFKIIIILPRERSRKERMLFRCIEDLEAVKGLSILSARPPKRFGEEEIDIIDLSADVSAFEETEEIYEVIHERLKRIIGDFRDFDEGIRRLETGRLSEVKDGLSEVEDGLVRAFYYSLDDFFRATAPLEEITEEIRLGVEVLDRHEISGYEFIVEGRDVQITLEDGKNYTSSTLIGLAYPSKRRLLKGFLNLLQEYRVTMSKIDLEESTILLLRVTKEGKPLSPEELKRLLQKLEKKGRGSKKRRSQGMSIEPPSGNLK